MDKIWFEMKELERRNLNKASWIPLYGFQFIEKIGQQGFEGYREDFFSCGTIAVPLDKKQSAEKHLNWSNAGIGQRHQHYIEDGTYYEIDEYHDLQNEFSGVYLALERTFSNDNYTELRLNQDIEFALGLKREGDVWVRPEEGYIDVARLKYDDENKPILLEIRAEHLKDYLCARKMALYISTYRQRELIVKEQPDFSWDGEEASGCENNMSWSRFVQQIHEGGHIIGDSICVIHIARTDVDIDDDVPTMDDEPSDENISSESWVKSFTQKKLYDIRGELWKNEWIEPAQISTRVGEDEEPPISYFITDTSGNRETKVTLLKSSRWLFFSPTVINDLMERRGGNLVWYTALTGNVGCLEQYCVHFGVNRLGLINVYAKDIARLPNWQQQIWAGHNVVPDGKVSKELLDSQVSAAPADTQAPEEYLLKGLELLNDIFKYKLGFPLLRENDEFHKIIKKCHRFRSLNFEGLCGLAKDLARVTADSIATSSLQKIVTPPEKEKWGSLKTMEKYLSTLTSEEEAHAIMGPLFAIYELRTADAHMPGKDYIKQLASLSVNSKESFVFQAYQMLGICVNSIYNIVDIIKSV